MSHGGMNQTTVVITIIMLVIAPSIAVAQPGASSEVNSSTTASSPTVEAGSTWNVSVGGPENDEFNAIVRSGDGGYVAAGEFGGTTFTDGVPWLVKVDSTGSVIWNKTFRFGFGEGMFHEVIRTADGGYLAVGEVESLDKGGAIAVKVAPDGSVEWKKRYGGSESTFFDVATTTNGYVFAGNTFLGPQNESSRTNYSNGLFVKIDDSGDKVWRRAYGLEDVAEGISSIHQTENGTYRFFGNLAFTLQWWGLLDTSGALIKNRTVNTSRIISVSVDSIKTSDGYAVASYSNFIFGGPMDPQLILTDRNGKIQLNRTYDLNISNGTVHGFTQTPKGGFVYAMEKDSSAFSPGGKTGVLMKLGPNGDKKWVKEVGPDGGSEIKDVITKKSGTIIFTGMINTTDDQDGWIAKTNLNASQPATFDISYRVSSTTVSTGENLSITATVENTGTKTGSTNITFYKDGQSIATKKVTLNGGTNTTISVNITFESTGSHTVSVENLSPTTITVNPAGQGPPPVVGDKRPTDPDNDGEYEDVNGNGEFDVVDVAALLDNLTSDAVQSNVAAFDFNDNGAVDIVDVAALLDELN